MAVRRLDDDEKLIQTMFVSGQNREVLLVNEPGLYSLVLTSRKPQAKTFKRWLTHEVIPSIRKTGQYKLPQGETQIEDIDALLIQTQNAITALISTRLELREVRQAVELTAARQECLEKRIQVVEVEQDRYQTPSGHKYTVLGFANKQGIQISRKEASEKGRKASALCRGQGIEIERIYDPRFGRVGLYPESVLLQIFAG